MFTCRKRDKQSQRPFPRYGSTDHHQTFHFLIGQLFGLVVSSTPSKTTGKDREAEWHGQSTIGCFGNGTILKDLFTDQQGLLKVFGTRK